MGKQWSYLIFLAWLSYLMIAGLLMFTGGFLLSRVSRKEIAECTSDLDLNPKVDSCGIEPAESESECNGGQDQPWLSLRGILSEPQSAASACLGRRAKVVLLVVDALKHEFTVWNENVTSQNASYHENKLPIIHDLLETNPSSSRLYKFIADPPTTTMQRLKGLTTGTLPTFVDVGSNFATEEINEDNLIDQCSKKGIVFMGDDTWIGLYPNRFLRQYPYPSFNVWDLDTVDNGVRKHIYSELNNTDWSLLIAHILGVDHCGHRHGPNHPEMARKLNETNYLIKDIIDSIDSNTMLFVIGDHGMTETGDHGGDSPAELDAAMFVYSSVPLLNSTFSLSAEEVHQIDLVPTLASILGVAVPFSNIGTVVLDSLPGNSHGNTHFEDFQYALHSVWSNVAQTARFVEKYSSETLLFPKDKLEALEARFHVLAQRVKAVNNSEEFRSFAKDAKGYLKLIRDMCEEVWVQFDSNFMSRGLLLMFATIFFASMIVDGIPRDRIPEIFESSFLLCSVCANLVTAFVIYVLVFFEVVDDFKNTVFFVTGTVSVFMLAMLVIQNWEVISINWYNGGKSRNWLNYCSKAILLLTVCGLFSNSYVVEEGTVLSFLVVTTISLLLFHVVNRRIERPEKRLKSSPKTISPMFRTVFISLGLAASVSLRLSGYYRRCREESRQSSCEILESRKPSDPVSDGSAATLIALSALAVCTTVVRTWLQSCGNLAGFSPSSTVARYCPSVIVVCTGGFWLLQRYPKHAKGKFIPPWQVDMLAWVVYFLIFVGIFLLYFRPLCVYLSPKKRESISVYNWEDASIIPQLFNRMKGLIHRRKDEDNNEDIPVAYGLGTAYSATFVSLSIFLTLLCALLLGDALAPSAVLMYVVCASVLGIITIERYQHATDINELFEVPTPSLLCWFLISEYFFYGTGHQPTFPTIHWDAAFVGTGGHFYTNLIPAALIGINTFGSHIILGASLPLIVIAPFTLYLMFPSLAKLQSFPEKEMRRGELLLYERDADFFSAMFTVSGKYMLFHSVRTFGCMLAGTVHCRHLMVWKIFAPKLIFEGLGLMVTLGSVLASFILVIRINHQIERLITRLAKSS